MTRKVAVVLFNLGGPDNVAAIRPFLFNFFTDKNIIRAPYPVRCLVAWLIARKRSKNEAGSAYAKLGGKSPLLDNTVAQAAALQTHLNQSKPDTQHKVFVCMRYWHPMADAVATDIQAFAPDEIVLLPLYPQYSTTTTRSSLQSWGAARRKAGLTAPERSVCCYHDDAGFIAASAARVRVAVDAAPAPVRVLFSAHGLPEKVVADGDPYQWQCEQSAAAIAVAAGVQDWQICYQSRVGPLRWIGPSTEAALEKAAADKVGVVVFPHAFTQEHVETLVEIDDEYREKAAHLGVPYFGRAETVGTHPDFIAGLARLVTGETPARTTFCPASFCRCFVQERPS